MSVHRRIAPKAQRQRRQRRLEPKCVNRHSGDRREPVPPKAAGVPALPGWKTANECRGRARVGILTKCSKMGPQGPRERFPPGTLPARRLESYAKSEAAIAFGVEK